MTTFRDEHLRTIYEAVRERCRAFDDEYWSEHDAQHKFPWDFYSAMAKDGWVGLALPEKYGGGGQGITEAAVMMRSIAESGAAMNGCTPLHLTIFGLMPVLKFGSDQLKEEFLPRAADGSLHVAFGVTEPDAGTDTSRIKTVAKPVEGGWLISGQKIWTSKALESEVVLLLARTSTQTEDRFGGLSLFLADLNPDHVQIRPISKLGRNAVASCETFYDELPVDASRLVGEEGRGFQQLLAGLNAERIMLASEAVGIGNAALSKAVAYANEREVFGRKIGANQALSHPLAHAHAQLEAAWEMCLVAAERYDEGLSCGAEANIAKYLAAEAGFFAADRAMQTLGGLGYATEYHVERYWREARLLKLAPVSQEMSLNFIAQNVLQLPRSY